MYIFIENKASTTRSLAYTVVDTIFLMGILVMIISYIRL